MGVMREDRIEATSEAHARSLLESKREYVVKMNEVEERRGGHASLVAGKKASVDEIATTVRQISILLRAGIPLVEGLTGLVEQARSASLRRCLQAIANDVSQGASLSEGFSKHPSIFPQLAVDMAKIAEAGGDLAESMSRLADHMESGAEIRRKVRSALAYPVVIILISVATVVLMVTFILPRFMELFSKMGAKLPWTTKALMSTSHLLTSQWYLFLGGAILAIWGAKYFVSTPLGRRRVDAILLKLPLIGEVVTKIVLNRTMASMSTLLSSGVPMVQTLETSASAANNLVVKEAIMTAARSVAEGNTTSSALKATAVFPPLVLQMVTSGEKTGELPAMLEYVGSLYARETDAKVKSLTSVIEPIMIVVLGGIVGFIAISVIVPIYSLVGGVK